jgi:hypothetical protein
MSETPEPVTQPVAATTTATSVDPTAPVDPTVVEPRERRSGRVVQAAAWVGIVAGTVFVVAVIFFSGFILGKHSGGGRFEGGPPRHHEMMFREGPPMMMPMRPDPGTGPGGPGMYGPGPGSAVPGNAGPAQPAAPTPPRP